MDWGTCYGSGSWTDYGLALTSRRITGNAESEMQQEIYNSGPISACLDVYENFFSVPSGLEQHIYTRAEGAMAGGHAIVLSGWGDSGDTPIWLLKNSWSTGCYIMFLRGSNLCNIESYDVSAFSVTSVQALAQGSNASSPEGNGEEMAVPGGWYPHGEEGPMWKQLADAWMHLSGQASAAEAPAVLSVHTRVTNGVAAKLTVGAADGGRAAGAGGARTVE